MATEPAHVAIVHPRYARLILAGEKTAEARLGRDRRAPFGAVTPGDRVWFKQKSGGYVGVARVTSVASHELRSEDEVDALRRAYDDAVRGGRAFWDAKRGARYATLIWFTALTPRDDGPDLRRFVAPGCRNAWHVVPAGVPALAAA